MQWRILALAIGALVVVGSSAALVATLADSSDDEAEMHHVGANEEHLRHGMAGDFDHDGDGHADTGMERPAFAPAEGSVPTAKDAESLKEVRSIVIRDDADFIPSNGVQSGNGTLDDPYIITGYYVTGDLYLEDTDACVIVKENYVRGQLTLNWNGQCVHAHHNYIGDLRVNENNRRVGYATGGLLEMNKIGYIGQLRHYDGEFRENVVGPYLPTNVFDEVMETVPVPFVEDVRIANIDGFNEAMIHHNTFHGSVDLDLHGHHHGTGFFAPHSHYHGDDMDRGMEHDHTDRWTSVFFTDNKVIDPEGYGLRYEDRNHAGDDQTANSESEETLEHDHRHHTWVDISRNHLTGSGIWIDVFNADDSLHYTRNPGWVDVRDNVIEIQERKADIPMPWFRFDYAPNTAILVNSVKEVDVLVEGNTATWVPLESNDPVSEFFSGFAGQIQPAMIELGSVRDSNITVSDNMASGFYYGVRAHHMDSATDWSVTGNDFGTAQEPIWYDDTVETKPST